MASKWLHGLTAPRVRAGTRGKVEALEREDYQGKEIIHEAASGPGARVRQDDPG